MDDKVLVIGAGPAGLAVTACGTRFGPHAVVAATGYTTGLTPLVGHLSEIDERGNPPVTGPRQLPVVPGLRFVGLPNP